MFLARATIIPQEPPNQAFNRLLNDLEGALLRFQWPGPFTDGVMAPVLREAVPRSQARGNIRRARGSRR